MIIPYYTILYMWYSKPHNSNRCLPMFPACGCIRVIPMAPSSAARKSSWEAAEAMTDRYDNNDAIMIVGIIIWYDDMIIL